jgi:lipopolysaccharide/colanic/teichoic acid biosynthesis glycosyltransferase
VSSKVKPPHAPPRLPFGWLWTVRVPDPPSRAAFSYLYRLGTGISYVLLSLVILGIVGTLTGWEVSLALIVAQGLLIVTMTMVSEGLLTSVYARLQTRHLEESRRVAVDRIIEVVQTEHSASSDVAPISLASQRTQRLLDLGVSIMGVLCAAPLMLAIIILIRLESRGPAIVRTLRSDRAGRVFLMYEFRTGFNRERFKSDADVPDDRYLPVRLTPSGRFLRRHSLHALPQLFNVLKGDMTLIRPGPPHLQRGQREARIPVPEDRPGLIEPWMLLDPDNPSRHGEVQRLFVRYRSAPSLRLHLEILVRAVSGLVRGRWPEAQ